MAKFPKSPTPVLATKHKDKRANIPTEELRGFVADDEKAPKKILCPLDPSLDPQLVWQGKDEPDRSPLEVPAVPIYIQEKIHPQVIIENLRETAKAGEAQQPLELFGDFNGIKFEQLIEFYQLKDGQIRNSSTDDIACWFIDTDYNGESFFVRHAYFTGADEPYEKLKRALRADIDEAAWSFLYSTLSRPFEKPKTGKIAIKVINHYGDEVLKVFDVK